MAGRRSASRDRRRRRARRSGPELATVGDVRALTPAGEAVVASDLGTVLVFGGLPGEEVDVRGVHREGKVLRGREARVLRASPERRPATCPRADACGGCALGVASQALEEQIKRAHLQRALGPVAPELEVEWCPAPRREGYRGRARLHHRRHALGYRARRGLELVDIPDCEVLAPRLNEALQILREELSPVLVGAGEIALALRSDGGVIVASRVATDQPPETYRALERCAATSPIVGAMAWIGAGAPARFGDADHFVEGADSEPLYLPFGGFGQAQPAVNRALALHVANEAEVAQRRVLELYAGAGNFSILLARGAASFESVEFSEEAVEMARRNLRLRGLRGALRVGRAEDAAGEGAVDVVVLDPPRSGALAAIAPVVARRPERIVYVSCQPTTLGRDLRELHDAGYQPTRAVAFDMFPKTAHVESAVTLARRGR